MALDAVIVEGQGWTTIPEERDMVENTAPELLAVSDEPADDGPCDTALIEEDLLVEDVSIDGMCGVY
jgi:mycofactocin precursor